LQPSKNTLKPTLLQLAMTDDPDPRLPPPAGIPDDNKVGNEDEQECPCAKVRRTCASWLASHPDDVTIDASAIPKLCDDILERQRHASLEWDSEGWHYRPPPEWPHMVRQERIALYILALDAVNFCFWPHEGYEYDDLATTLTSIASIDHHHAKHNDDDGAPSLETYALSATHLSHMSVEEMTALFARHHPKSLHPPDMDQRCRLWNEVGSGLLSHFGGSAMKFIERAHGSAPDLVRLLLDFFPGFRDYASEVWFLKRAQICVGDLNAALHLKLKGMDQLTTFPDYRVPQLLREYGILTYSAALADKVDALVELAAGSSEECSIRAATVLAVDYVVQKLNSARTKEEEDPRPSLAAADPKKDAWTAVEADWVLWQIGESRIASMRPHHRVRTTFY
jgi:Potential Queuosine, Q, salvage protein family